MYIQRRRCGSAGMATRSHTQVTERARLVAGPGLRNTPGAFLYGRTGTPRLYCIPPPLPLARNRPSHVGLARIHVGKPPGCTSPKHKRPAGPSSLSHVLYASNQPPVPISGQAHHNWEMRARHAYQAHHHTCLVADMSCSSLQAQVLKLTRPSPAWLRLRETFEGDRLAGHATLCAATSLQRMRLTHG